MLEFEVTGNRNNFIDLQKIFLEVKCKITQSSGADLKYDAGAAADITKTDAPTFVIMSYVHYSLTVQCLQIDWKLQMLTWIMLNKCFVETKFSHNQDAEKHVAGMSGLLVWGESWCLVNRRNE